ncbi:MAG: hypothetical protein FWE80_02750 [Oscillospiraceae bacterium]|nr:hypothetical protein [Oscillospiraceae bacterium]
MKKLFAVLAVLTLVLSAGSVFAFAGSDTVGLGNKDINVEAKYEGGTSTPTVYSVDLAWGAMQFTFNAGGTFDWDADTHEYDNNTTASWTASGDTVTVTNHSNAAIDVSMAYTQDASYTSVTGTIEDGNFTLPSAVGKDIDDAALSGTAKLLVGGTIASDKTSFVQVGKITVTIAAAV